jgi:hypothetical protein
MDFMDTVLAVLVAMFIRDTAIGLGKESLRLWKIVFFEKKG